MTDTLTNQQRNLLEFIILQWESGEALPSAREICNRFAWTSPKAATDALSALTRKGFLISKKSGARKYRLAEQSLGIPVFGEIAAGLPVDSVSSHEERLTLNPMSLGIRNRQSAFFLRVRGDSMIGKHIFAGDLVLLEKTDQPRNKDIVAALIDNESTLKTFIQDRQGSWLKSENPSHPDLRPSRELQIQGVARSVIRRLHT